MKRCPRCDFIYEDDQGLCDMDGSELECVHEVSPAPHAATTRTPRPSALGRRRLPALLIAGVILGVVLPSSYYVNTSQTATVPTGRAPADASATTAVAPLPENTPVPEVTAPRPEPPPEPPPTTKVRPAAASRKRGGAKAPAVRPAIKPSPPKSAEREARAPSPQGTSGKKESKLGAVLKKTGQILKKPFGF